MTKRLKSNHFCQKWRLFLSMFACLVAFDASCAQINASPLSKMNSEGYLTYYEGSITVSGEYFQDERDPFISSVCFYPKGPSALLIPRENDNRVPWFCFSNNELAMHLFKMPASPSGQICRHEGVATVQISNYVVNKLPSEVSDIAKLDKLLSSEKASTKECEDIPKYE